MTITITATIFGFHIAIVSQDSERFAATVERFKALIPKKCREYKEEYRYWYVEKRAEKRLHQWVNELLTSAGDLQIYKRRAASKAA